MATIDCKHCGEHTALETEAMQGTFLFASGRWEQLSLCPACAAGELDLVRIWKRNIERNVKPPNDSNQNVHWQEAMCRDAILAPLFICPHPQRIT